MRTAESLQRDLINDAEIVKNVGSAFSRVPQTKNPGSLEFQKEP